MLILQWLVPWTYRKAHKIVCVSKGLIETHRRISRLPRGKYEAIYDPVVSNQLIDISERPISHEWVQDGSIPLIVSVGRFSPIKDYPTLVRAFARVRRQRKAHLIIVGGGPGRAELEDLVASLGIESDVYLPGFVENPLGYVRRADVFALTSLQEGLSDVIIEALACGTTVVSTDCPTGPREILMDGKLGKLVPVADYDALADAMMDALDNPLPPEHLKKRAQDFTVEKSVDAYERVLFGEAEGSTH